MMAIMMMLVMMIMMMLTVMVMITITIIQFDFKQPSLLPEMSYFTEQPPFVTTSLLSCRSTQVTIKDISQRVTFASSCTAHKVSK